MDELIEMAEADYRLAWEAIPRLDGGFARASAVAAEVYRAIHFRVVANGYNNFTERSRTSSPDKVRLMVRALIRLWTEPVMNQ
jgi:phytoene/squalene synthetase